MRSPAGPLLLLLFVVCVICPRSSKAIEPKDKLERLMEYFATNNNFNGSVLVARKGNILLAKGYGWQDVEKKIKNSENSVFQIGTGTMQFTAELLLMIDAQGKLSLDDKVAKFIPTYPGGDKISIKNLLTHTAGVYDYSKDTAIMAQADKPITRDSLLALFKNRPRPFEPGEKFEYSYGNYAVLACIAEQITDRKYEWLIRERIFMASGMYHSGFDFTSLADENKAIGYLHTGADNTPAARGPDSSISFAAAGMYSTVGDMYKFHRTLQEYKLLPKDWQEIAYTPYKNHYAFGWEVENMFQKKFLQSAGNINGFSSYELRQENDDVCIILLQNNTVTVEDNKLIADNIAQCLYDKDYRIPGARQLEAEKEKIVAREEAAEEKEATPRKKEIAEKKDNSERAEKVKIADGEYSFDPSFSITISHDGKDIYAKATGQDAFRILPDRTPLFYKAGVDARIEFVKDEKGNVNKLILHQHGRDMQAVKN
jgi:CubicO group peptidase (beta-lactamase class C family)